MGYLIAKVYDFFGNQEIVLETLSDMYCIEIKNLDNGDYQSKVIKTKEKAFELYEKLNKAVITGAYSYEQRKEWLK